MYNYSNNFQGTALSIRQSCLSKLKILNLIISLVNYKARKLASVRLHFNFASTNRNYRDIIYYMVLLVELNLRTEKNFKLK